MHHLVCASRCQLVRHGGHMTDCILGSASHFVQRQRCVSVASELSSTPSQSSSATVPVWSRFHRAVTTLNSGYPDERAATAASAWERSADAKHVLQAPHTIRSLWHNTYHRCFLPEDFTPHRDVDTEDLFPSACEDLLCMLQSLIDCLRAAPTREDVAGEELFYDEVRATVLLLIEARLLLGLETVRGEWRRPRREEPPPVPKAAVSVASRAVHTDKAPFVVKPVTRTNARRPKLSMGRGKTEAEEEEEERPEEEETAARQHAPIRAPSTVSAGASSTAVLAVTDASRPNLAALGLRRPTAETVEAMTARDTITPTQQLQWMVLVDTLFLIATAHPVLSLTRRAQHTLYLACLVTLEVAEQLPSASVAALVECLARWAQGYTTTQQMDSTKSDDCPPSVVETAVDTMDPRPFMPSYSAAGRRPSAVEAEENAEMDVMQGGLHTAVTPITVIGHLDVISRVLTQRMARTMSAVDTVPRGANNDCGTPRKSSLGEDEAGDGLLSLAQKKAKRAADEQSKGSIRAAVLRASDTSNATHNRDRVSCARETDVIALTDVAQMSTGLASLRYMDTALWDDVARFTVWTVQLTSVLKRGDGTEQTEEEEAVDEADALLLRDVRDVCFALDYVKHTRGYDDVMRALVEAAYLQHPIPPPSQSLQDMKRIKQPPL